MAKKKRSIEQTCTVRAQPAEVYRMFTSSSAIREWLADVALATPREAGPLYLAWNDGNSAAGRYTELSPFRRVGFTWRGDADPVHTRVEVDLRPVEQGTVVSVRQSGFEKGTKPQRRAFAAAWATSLENLVSVMETGLDLRFTRRPMLGVAVDRELDAEGAARIGLPVDHGVVLSGVVPGTGAAAAGLTSGDALVELDGVPLTGWASLGAILQSHHAGDTVSVKMFREGREETTELTLSGRPIPEVPETAVELADFVRSLYTRFDAELAACFEGVDEETAARKPAPTEWSAKEVLAHLLDGEGDSHSSIIETVLGVVRHYDGGFENSDHRTSVTAGSYPTVAGMLAALTRLEHQTVALLEGLPDRFVARKSSFWPLAYGYTQAEIHFGEHLEQIKATLAG